MSRVTFWDVHDEQSWRYYLYIKRRSDCPLLFDRQYKTRPAFDLGDLKCRSSIYEDEYKNAWLGFML